MLVVWIRRVREHGRQAHVLVQVMLVRIARIAYRFSYWLGVISEFLHPRSVLDTLCGQSCHLHCGMLLVMVLRDFPTQRARKRRIPNYGMRHRVRFVENPAYPCVILDAATAAPKPLSMFTTVTPAAHEFSAVSSGATPLKATP